MRFTALLVVGCALSGCDDKKAKEKASAPVESAKAPASAKPSASAAPDLGPAADALLKSWLAAQNESKFDAYIALYDTTFKGVRRTSDGTEKSFDLAGWRADREKLFKKKQEVVADTVVKKIEAGVVTLTFVQRWKSGKFADHGEKVLELRAEASGALRVVREELKWSEHGWEDSKEKAFDATALVSPITMTVEEYRAPDNGDCSVKVFRVHLKDDKGTAVKFEYGSITGGGGEMTNKGGPIAPKGGEYTDLGVYCAGLQQGYKLKVSGDTIVALSIWNDEDSGEGKETKVIAKLPPGAKVSLK